MGSWNKRIILLVVAVSLLEIPVCIQAQSSRKEKEPHTPPAVNAQGDGNDCGGLELIASPEPQILNERTPGIDGCQARITSPPGTSIQIRVTASNCFSINSDLGFYVPGDTSVKLRVCLDSQSGFGLSWPLPLTILFDNDVFLYETASGLTFQLEYSHVPFVENICNVQSPLKVGPFPKHLTSPSFGVGPYYSNEECTVTIQGSSECQIRLESNSSIESGFDFLTVCPDAPIGDASCTTYGDEPFTTDIFTAVNEATVRFQSDIFAAARGFDIEYSCIPVFSEWSPWRVVGCPPPKLNSYIYTLISKEERTRDCLIPPCEEEDLKQTRFTLCFLRCIWRCCNGRILWK